MPSYLITGASRGLGYAFVKQLAADPANIVIGIVRNKASTEERIAKDDLKFPNLHILEVADVTDYPALQAAAKATDKITGEKGLDVLVHNAARVIEEKDFFGIAEAENDIATVSAEFSKHFETNVNGVLLTTTAFLPLIRKSSIKKVIAITTGMADLDLVIQFEVTNGAAYSVSKAALNLLIAKYHANYGKTEGILFLGISPGVVNTAENKTYTDKEMAGIQKMMKKFAIAAPDWKGPITPEQSAKMVLKVVDRADVEKFGGQFVSHSGDKQWLQNVE